MDRQKRYFKSVNVEEFVSKNREDYKARNGFNNTLYYESVSFSMKLYQQGLETGKDIQGNDLTPKEINICKMLIEKMNNEITLARDNYIKEQGV